MENQQPECSDDHSNGRHCPLHGFDNSVPPPAGYSWYSIPRIGGHIYVAMIPFNKE